MYGTCRLNASTVSTAYEEAIEEDILKEFYARAFRERRDELGLSKQGILEDAHQRGIELSFRYLKKIETGECWPKLTTLGRLARAYRLTAEELLKRACSTHILVNGWDTYRLMQYGLIPARYTCTVKYFYALPLRVFRYGQKLRYRDVALRIEKTSPSVAFSWPSLIYRLERGLSWPTLEIFRQLSRGYGIPPVYALSFLASNYLQGLWKTNARPVPDPSQLALLRRKRKQELRQKAAQERQKRKEERKKAYAKKYLYTL